MAEFRMKDERALGVKEFVIADRVLNMNVKGTVRFSFGRAMVDILASDGQLIRTVTSQRGVIEAPDGAQVLPYFMGLEDSQWYVVLVEQFRIAIPAQTIEAPGGEVDEVNPRESMARELWEEAHIRVTADDIELVYCERIQPSMMAARIWGGVVEVDESQLPSELLGGEFALGEYTVLVTRPLLELLKDRDALKFDLDLMLSRLIDEVAKRVRLLNKNY